MAHVIQKMPQSPSRNITQLARAFDINRGSFYLDYKVDKKDKALAVAIEKIHEEQDDTLGHKKLAVLLGTGKNRVLRVMKKYDIVPRPRSKKYQYAGQANDTVSNKMREADGIVGDHELLFGSVIFSDIFEFQLQDETRVRGCFALLKDTRQILSLIFDYRMKADLVVSTIQNIDTTVMMNLKEDSILWHTDQGSQYGARGTIESLLHAGFERSMSRAGTPTDNPYAERFVGIFKHAVVRKKKYKTLHEFSIHAKKWINFYNNDRPHEGIQMMSPNAKALALGYAQVPMITNIIVH